MINEGDAEEEAIMDRGKKKRKLYNSNTKLRNLYECENIEWFISLVFIIFIGSIQPFEFKKKDTMR